MGKNPKAMPSSCKFLLNDNDSTASMILVKSYGEMLPPVATLRIDDSGKSWRVTVEKFKDQYFFTDGWKEFAQDVDLNSWDCLMFNTAGSSEFRGPNHIQDVDSVEDGDGVPDREEASCAGKKWSFTKELKKNNAYRLVLPRKFAIGTGIATSKSITLKDAKGRKWPVRVADSCGDIAMGSGWNAFLIANKVIVGSTVLFEFVLCSKLTVEAHVIKEGTDENALFNFVKRKKNGKFEVVTSRKTREYEDESKIRVDHSSV